MTTKLGIGIVTYKRADLALQAIERVHALTRSPFSLIVADDGSPKAVVDLIRERARVVTGRNRGVAGNKNRALFHLAEVEQCDTIILLEDDTHPTEFGWEEPWIQACRRWGHVNFVGNWKKWAFRGTGTPASPYNSTYISGQCSGFSREALAMVGYLDPRFRGFGWEHVEHTARMVRAGYGGYLAGERFVGFVIESALSINDSESFSDTKQLVHNESLYKRIVREPVYRTPWLDDLGMHEFRREQKSVGSVLSGWGAVQHVWLESELPLVSIGKPATQSSVSTWTPGRTAAEDAAHAVSGHLTGGKQFHTDHEREPWWQVDLEVEHEIGEVRIFNAMGQNADRSRHLRIKLSSNGRDWTVAYVRAENEAFGGADGHPMRWIPSPKVVARYVRISIATAGSDPLHLDQVAVYGTPRVTAAVA